MKPVVKMRCHFGPVEAKAVALEAATFSEDRGKQLNPLETSVPV